MTKEMSKTNEGDYKKVMDLSNALVDTLLESSLVKETGDGAVATIHIEIALAMFSAIVLKSLSASCKSDVPIHMFRESVLPIALTCISNMSSGEDIMKGIFNSLDEN